MSRLLLLLAALLATGSAEGADSASRPAVVTLITGDRVRLSFASPDEPVVSVDPAPGREAVEFVVRTVKTAAGMEVTVVPNDAVRLLGADRLDPQLFNISELVRQGFDDASASTLPLIVTYAGKSTGVVGALSARPARPLWSVGGEAIVKDKQDAGVFWNAITGRGALGVASSHTLAANVAKVWLDARAVPMLDASAPQIGAPEIWRSGWTGRGVTVAVLDTGLRADHPDFQGRIAEAVDFTGAAPGAADDVGHGTHVAGIIAGTGAASGGRYKGIAPEASLIVGKVCVPSGCPSSAIIAGMEWAAPRARIVNMSLGSTRPTDGTDPLAVAVNALTAAYGTLFVAAAGNAGAAESVSSPASADAALAVASVDKPGALSSFSSRGPRIGDFGVKPEIAAPGGGIVAARAKGTTGGDRDPIDDHYTRLSGTSMAAPHIAGSAALLAQKHPSWRAAQIKAALMSRTVPVAGANVYAVGTGRVDLPRAFQQQVYVASGTLGFGLIPWPHDAPSATRSVTYQNDGDAAVTLALTVDAVDATGAAAPPGLFTVDPVITIPAHGSATASLTMTPQATRSGLYSLVLAASDGVSTVRAAGGVHQEPEAYDLTIDMLDRQGGEAEWAFGFVLDTATGANRSINGPATRTKFRLPRGQYDVDALLYVPEGRIVATAPSIALDRDRAVLLDGRQAVPLEPVVDRPTARLWWNSVSMHARATNGLGATTLTLTQTPFWVLPTQKVTDHIVALDYRAWLRPLPIPTGGAAAGDFIYNLVFPFVGGVPPRPDVRVRDRELATVHARYHAQGEATTLRSNAGRSPSGASLYITNWSQPLPGRQLELYTPNITWGETLTVYPPSGPTLFGGERTVSTRVYEPGRHYVVPWYSAPIGPTFGPAEPLWGAYRVNNRISVYLTPFSSGAQGHATLSHRGTTRLLRDGVLVGTSANVAYGAFNVPAEAGTYTVEAEGTRDVAWSVLGTVFRGAWTFRSAPAPADQLHRLPLMLIDVSAVVDDHGGAPAGLPYLLGVNVQRQAQAPTAPIAELKLDVSYDDGASWQPAPVTHHDGRGLALVFHPRAPGFVSLRAHTRDRDGNTADHTILRAYRTREPRW